MFEAATMYGILVAVDGSVESDAAIRWAAREAVMRNQPVPFMHVVAPVPDWSTPSRRVQVAEAWEQNASGGLCVTSQPTGSSRNRTTRRSWCSAVTASAGSPGCCWAR